MEHWLPLYYEKLETLFDYLPGAAVTLDGTGRGGRGTTGSAAIADFYEARLDTKRGAPVYRPVRPEQFTIEEREWQAMLRTRAVAELSAFAAPEGVASFDAGARPVAGFRRGARRSRRQSVRRGARPAGTGARGGPARAASSPIALGSADRLETVLHEHGVATPSRVADFAGVRGAAGGTFGSAVLPIEHGYATDKIAVLTEQDILGDRLARPARRRARNEQFHRRGVGASARRSRRACRSWHRPL